MNGPNPLTAARSIIGSMARVRRPAPGGVGHADTGDWHVVLEAVALRGPKGLAESSAMLDTVVGMMATSDPDRFDSDGSLAYWLDLYNAGALALAARAAAAGEDSVLRLPGAFSSPFVTVAGEPLSLDAIEHAKIRRFGDPRIHSALVCGSVSCPTLRPQPYSGTDLHHALDDQMAVFLGAGGLWVDGDIVRLSRVFAWYGSDFVRPDRMPTFLPSRRRHITNALLAWVPDDLRGAVVRSSRVEFQPYDWGLRCTLG